jgi:Domain of unknown function DUF29
MTQHAQDFASWCDEQAAALRHRAGSMRIGEAADVDWLNLAEEIESVGQRERLAVREQLTNLCARLLGAVDVLPCLRSSRWDNCVDSQRAELREMLTKSPSLFEYAEALLPRVYADALAKVLEARRRYEAYRLAAPFRLKEEPLQQLPERCPLTLTELLDQTYLPNGGPT